MERLSILIFSRDKLDEVFELINDLYDLSNEIVLVDCSSVENAKRIFDYKTKLKLDKLKIFRTAPLGHPNPYRTFGLNKCKNYWVLLIDTDERLNPQLKKDILDIITNSKVDGFFIDRRSCLPNGKVYWKGDYQLRLYKKSKITYGGIIDELAQINGTVKRLDPNVYFMTHVPYQNIKASSDKVVEKSKDRIYLLEAYTHRLTYSDLANILGYNTDLKYLGSSVLKNSLGSFAKFYLDVKRVNYGSELSKFDYSVLYFYSVIGYITDSFPIINFDWIKTRNAFYKGQLGFLFSFPEKERIKQLEIRKALRKDGGDIKYLFLDNEKVVKIIYNRFKNDNFKGAELLIKLLNDRYNFGKYYYKKYL
jgi:hypothetical protein